MSVLHLLPVGEIGSLALEGLRRDLAAEFRARCELLPQRLDPEFAFHNQRRQYHSTEILKQMERGTVFVTPKTLEHESKQVQLFKRSGKDILTTDPDGEGDFLEGVPSF